MEKKKFNMWNRIVAWAVFAVSAAVYLATIEPTASFWDCGEFIASSYKLEVGHPPGNPVFQLFARFFSMWVDPAHAAVAVNAMNAILSAPCHTILTMRTKMAYAMEENERGKMQPVKLGLAPVQRENTEYEFE